MADQRRRINALIEGREQYRLLPVGATPVQWMLAQGRRRRGERPRGLLRKDAAADGHRTGGNAGVIRCGHRQAAGAVGAGFEQQGVGAQPAPAAGYRRRQLHRHLVRVQVRPTGSRYHRLVERHAQVRRHRRIGDGKLAYHLQLATAGDYRCGAGGKRGKRYRRCTTRTDRNGRRRQQYPGHFLRSVSAIGGSGRQRSQQLPRSFRREWCGCRRARHAVPNRGLAQREQECLGASNWLARGVAVAAPCRALHADRPKEFFGHVRSPLGVSPTPLCSRRAGNSRKRGTGFGVDIRERALRHQIDLIAHMVRTAIVPIHAPPANSITNSDELRKQSIFGTGSSRGYHTSSYAEHGTSRTGPG